MAEIGLAGSADAEVFGAALTGGYALLTENVGDFTSIAAQHTNAGGHHHGLLIALSSRFSRQPSGTAALVAAVVTAGKSPCEDRVIYLLAADGT